MTSAQNVYDEYQKSVEYGFVDPATGIDEMNAKMQKAGLDKIITEKQTQLDAWAAANQK
jgi:putative aldouronate transport system substrate-binding protein